MAAALLPEKFIEHHREFTETGKPNVGQVSRGAGPRSMPGFRPEAAVASRPR